MIEAMIAEAVLAGRGHRLFRLPFSGVDFLEMIVRKTKWLRRHRKSLAEAMLAPPGTPTYMSA